LALEGFCPVTLSDQERWVAGDPRWGARHEGRTYLFSGPAEQQRFLAEPARYAPVFSANDVVLAVDENRIASGQRDFGVWFPDPARGHVYLFSSEMTLRRFYADSGRYLDGLRRMTGKPIGLDGYGLEQEGRGTATRQYGPATGSYR
jgi:protein disulfide-isomerase